MLVKMPGALAIKIVTDALLEFLGRERPRRLDDGALAMHPPRLDRVQPRAPDRQPAFEYPDPAFALGLPVVRPHPGPHLARAMPGRIVGRPVPTPACRLRPSAPRPRSRTRWSPRSPA